MSAGWRTLVACVAGCLWWPTWASAAPSVFVETKTLDLGNHEPGVAFQHCITLINIGDEPLKLGSFETGCECLRAEVEKSTLAPMESTTLALTINPADMSGEVRRVVLFTTNDPEHPQIRLRVGYYIGGSLMVSPTSLQLAILRPGETISQTVFVRTATG